jgi:aquaporin NIP
VRARRLAAEVVGTFMLVAIGAGAAAVNQSTGGAVTGVGICLAFGCVVLAAIYTIGHVSGAHINPAVTFAFWVGGRFPTRDVIPYIAAQLTGATCAAFGLRFVLGSAATAAATVPSIPLGAALGVEITLTFILMLVVMAVATDARVAGTVAGLAVGAIVVANALMGGPLTGASMNPARSFGPALAIGTWTAHWIYWIGPIVGASIAAWTYDYLRPGTPHDHRVKRTPTSSPISPSLPMHREFGPKSDGRGHPQPQGQGPLAG